MVNEANAILSHHDCEVLIAKSWRALHFTAVTEFMLPNGRIADVFAASLSGEFYIAEVKHMLKDSLLESAYEKYGRFCNYLYVAVAGIVEADLDRKAPVAGFAQPWHRVGIIGVYPCTMRVLRPPSYRQVGRLDAAELTRLVRIDVGR